MPPKGWKKYPDGFKPVNSAGTPVKEKQKFKLDDLLLPRATIHKLATDALPEGSQMPSDGLLALRRSTAVFISYLSAEANNVAQLAGRKTVQPGDITKALENLKFGSFIPEVRTQLENYERFMAEKRKAKKEQPDESAEKPPEEEDHEISEDEEKDLENDGSTSKPADDQPEEEQQTKKPKLGDETELEE